MKVISADFTILILYFIATYIAIVIWSIAKEKVPKKSFIVIFLYLTVVLSLILGVKWVQWYVFSHHLQHYFTFKLHESFFIIVILMFFVFYTILEYVKKTFSYIWINFEFLIRYSFIITAVFVSYLVSTLFV